MEKLRELRKQAGLTTTQLGVILGCSNPTITHYERGDREPDHKTLLKIAHYFNVSVDYLLGRTDDEQDTWSQKRFPSEETINVPVIAKVAAGFDKPISEWDYDETLPVPKSIVRGYDEKDLFVFYVEGDSMSPKFLNGDKVLVHRTTSVDSGTVAIVSYYGFEDGTIKKVHYEPGCDYVDLIPLNPAYSPVRIQGEALEGCRVVGKVIYLFREV